MTLRGLVSGKKIRFKDGNYDLDLSYIAGSRIIAMGFPASGFASAYRNPAKQVADMLESEHHGHYRVYNLAEEAYNETVFHGNSEHYPFPDHHAPPFPLLLKILKSMHDFLEADSDNVVAAHCIAGMGRTGTVISSLLIVEGYESNASSALDHFASVRTANGSGVNFPSQVRTVQYFDEWYHLCKENGHNWWEPPEEPELIITSVSISNTLIGKKFQPQLVILDSNFDIIFNSAWFEEPPQVDCDAQLLFQTDIKVKGHFTIKLFDPKEELLRVSMNTFFMYQPSYVLTKRQIDICHHDSKGKYPDTIMFFLETANV